MLTSQKDLFYLPEDVTYLNCAYMSPQMKPVDEAGLNAVVRKRLPYEIGADDFFKDGEVFRDAFARLINVNDHNRVVIIPSVSYGLSSVAKNLKLTQGQKIIVAGEQFPSNFYPWKSAADEHGAEVETIAAPNKLEGRGEAWNNAILEAIDQNTAAVCIGHVHWADGTLFDLINIRQRTKEVGALLILDGTQSVGALPFDVEAIQPDALVCGGYKWLMGPYSIGAAYFGPYFDGGKPLEENWINRHDSHKFAELVNYQDKYLEGALRYEVGEHSNFVLLPMFIRALQQLNEWGPANIQAYSDNLTSEFCEKLIARDFWVEDRAYRSTHLFGVRLPAGADMAQVKQALEDNNIYVSVRGNAIRVSTHLFNDQQDLDKLFECLVSSVANPSMA
ncbi:MAG: aminotransferase class V-fold PLP-dependent enzyme [Bacteroidota bacterium]